MKKIIVLVLTFLASAPFIFSQEKAGKKDTAQHQIIYTCPVHTDVINHEAGKCPKCGMELNLSKKEEMKTRVTKAYSCPVHVKVTSHDPGKCPQCGKKMNLSPKEQMKAEVAKVYTCPMHPNVSLDKDGKCPKCGMALEEKKQK